MKHNFVTNPFAKIHNEQWVVPVSALSLVLGFMIVGAWVTENNRGQRIRSLSPDQQKRINEGAVDLDKYLALQSEVDKLQKKSTLLEKAIASKGNSSDTLNNQLQDVKTSAGLTELEGKGVIVTLRDKAGATLETFDNLIHDIDILKTTNELFAAGAEAISINGQRLVTQSSIRCAGPVVLVDGVKVASPFIISAIGDPDVLYSSYLIPRGARDEIAGASPEMVQITKEKRISIPAYLGPMARKVATVPKVIKK
jgi:uncharacterized protein YlxW (UPF0749 family)